MLKDQELYNGLFEYLKTHKGRCKLHMSMIALQRMKKRDEDSMPRFMMSQQILGRIYT
jgi:hypothetical protein